MWIIAAPAASQSWAVCASSSGVVGSCGQSSLAVSAPGRGHGDQQRVAHGVIVSERARVVADACRRPRVSLGVRRRRRHGRRLARRRPGCWSTSASPTPTARPRSTGWRARSGGCGSSRTSGRRPTSAAPVLVVSQFTLYGDARKGRRPTWEAAAPAPVSEPLYDAFCAALTGLGATRRAGSLRRPHAGRVGERGPVHRPPRRGRASRTGAAAVSGEASWLASLAPKDDAQTPSRRKQTRGRRRVGANRHEEYAESSRDDSACILSQSVIVTSATEPTAASTLLVHGLGLRAPGCAASTRRCRRRSGSARSPRSGPRR